MAVRGLNHLWCTGWQGRLPESHICPERIRTAFKTGPIMLRRVLLIAIVLACCPPTSAQPVNPRSGDRIQVEIELEFEETAGEIVHVEFKVPGRKDRPVKATLDFTDDHRLEMESVPIPGAQYQYKTKVSVIRKTSTGGGEVICRPQLRTFADHKAELQIASHKFSVLVRHLN